ncbi:hypothetical protein ACFO0N_08315 [Halobium salinum]|uniref:Uncharacterized protein n=1 Tax=Halobium salinum TaxID=1364940 RepID=A0ABD5PAP2_9EURY|nr:hypothetical protein [Halobium salinum]
MRELDTFDYAVVAAVAALAYVQLPWRPAIRRTLRETVARLAAAASTVVGTVSGVDAEVAVVLLGVVAVGLVVYLVEVLPGRG